jgi:hypothetical protein
VMRENLETRYQDKKLLGKLRHDSDFVGKMDKMFKNECLLPLSIPIVGYEHRSVDRLLRVGIAYNQRCEAPTVWGL